jgi:Family of unknown function (DUF5309)
MTTYQTYEVVGIKEDISDIITNLTPTKTPFQSAIGNEKVTQTLFEWQEDSLRAVAANAKLEGADATFITVNPTVLRTNRTQILTEAVQVSETTDVVSKYGRAKEMAYQMAKSSAQLKRDFENALVGTAQAAVVGADATARQFAGVQLQIANGTNDALNNITYTGGTIATPVHLSEAFLLTALQNAYNAGAEPNRIQVTPSNSVIVAAFAAAAGRYRTFQNGTAADKTIVNVVNLYVSPFGEQKIEINRFLMAFNTLIYDPAMWVKATLRPWSRTPLAKTGDSNKQMIVGEFSLKHKNYQASAMVVEAVSNFAPV